MSVRPEYFTLNKLLANRLFRIPHYQRAYSWKHEHRDAMFTDILKLKNTPSDSFHFMATVVGLKRKEEEREIATELYDFIEIVDGQQRITTLVLLLKAIERKLDCKKPNEKELSQELQKLLVKQDEATLILLPTNQEHSQYFANYLRNGTYPSYNVAKTLSDQELLSAIEECESFVNDWDSKVELLGILKNKLTFVYHEIDHQAAVYTVFETLNDRGLDVSWLDKLKSRLMRAVFEENQGNSNEHIDELHDIWGKIYATLGSLYKVSAEIGLREDVSSEILRFGATLKASKPPNQPLGEKRSVDRLMNICRSTSEAIKVSNWLLEVTNAYYKLLDGMKSSKKAVAKIVHARLLGLAILLRKCSADEKEELLEQWEKTTFRIFGLCGTDARKEKSNYVKLAWETCQDPASNADKILTTLRKLAAGYDIEKVFVEELNSYHKWQEQLRYLLFRYEQHLAEQKGQRLNDVQWKIIWENSVSRSIEHILPQSRGSQDPLALGQEGVFVHRLGNLMLLPLDDNSRLGRRKPEAKVNVYRDTRLLMAEEVANTIEESGWGIEQIKAREKRLIKWICKEWGEDETDSGSG